jgi:hypothetical protein
MSENLGKSNTIALFFWSDKAVELIEKLIGLAKKIM